MGKHNTSILLLIVIFAAILRLYGLNWDQGFHLHPDERAIVLFTVPLAFPASLSNFFSQNSSLNTHFFAYGNFPLYLLKLLSLLVFPILPSFAQYANINLLGRFLSAVFDLTTILILYRLSVLLFGKTVGLLASLFYAVSVFPIQAAHFYAVDSVLTTFILLTLYELILFSEKPAKRKAAVVGIIFGFGLATKDSALVLLSAIGLSLATDFFFIFFKTPHRPNAWFSSVPRLIKRPVTEGLAIVFFAMCAFIILEPYAIIDFQSFWTQTMQQSQMTHNAFIFPYTLQYVGITPYLYELKNVFLWGMGPVLSSLAFTGAAYCTFVVLKKGKMAIVRSQKKLWPKEGILLLFFWVYFAVIGHFAVGFMRYMLPLYPLFCLFAAVLFYTITIVLNRQIKKQNVFFIFYALFFILILVWPLSFMHIYSVENTRVSATSWILKNIPAGKTLAIEHWDDGLPLYGGQAYRIETLPLYNPDTPEKWAGINGQLARTDYIIIASNRLYVPLRKLTDCANLPQSFCYQQSAAYYKNLFDGSLGFKKVAEFAVYPTIPIIHIPINDESADESFTVYDHPKVIIFQKL